MNGKLRIPKTAKALMLALLSLILLASSGITPCVYAAEAQAGSTPVRVGYFYNGDFMYQNADGTYAGYDVEYYDTLAGYANWEIQFVKYDSLKTALAALEKGDIDVMSGLAKTEERVSDYLVSAEKMCTAQIAVQTRADDDRFAAGDTDTMKDLTCGILKGSNVEALYTEWCGENGLIPHIVEYNSLEERNAALLAGEVDALAGGSTVGGAQKIAVFPSVDLYFMFNRNRTDLKSQADRAMNILSLESPNYASDLFLKYFPASRNRTPSFSAAEKAYLAEHRTIRVAVLASDAPFSARHADGTVTGILPDYYAHLSEVTGVRFTCVAYPSKDKAFAAMRAEKVDLVGKFGGDILEADRRRVILTVPYLRMNMVQILRVGAGAIQTCAVPQCNAESAASTLNNMGSDASLQIRSNSEQCFELLKSGKVDSVICTQPAATWLLSRNRASDYMVSAFGGSTWDVVCALPYGESGNILRSILNQSIATDSGYINQLITSETLADSADLASFFDRLPVSVLTTAVVVAVVLLCIAGAAIMILVRRRKVERRIARRQAELAAEEDANRAKHAFFGAVSHDMRTPLNGIMGLTDLALASGDSEKMRDYLVKIRKSGAVLCGLVDDTLIMSRMENDKYRLQPTPVNTAEMFSEVLEPIRALAEEKGVHLRENISARWPEYLLADRTSLQKILLNLLSNAVRYTPSGGIVTLDCRLDPQEKSHPDGVIVVSDTGAGVAADFLPHIFEPFAQENPDHADTSGSGMGLSIVKHIVDAMGGTIEVASEKGKGAVFTVRLPLEELKTPPAVPQDSGGAALLKGKHALICEDNALNLEIVKTLLERYGMEVVGAENGKLGVEAFEKSSAGWFDVVLLDLRMPVMDGFTAARAIRAMDRPDAKNVPILAVSADAYADDVQKCGDVGMNGHIAKPIDPGILYDTLVEKIGVTRGDCKK